MKQFVRIIDYSTLKNIQYTIIMITLDTLICTRKEKSAKRIIEKQNIALILANCDIEIFVGLNVHNAIDIY